MSAAWTGAGKGEQKKWRQADTNVVAVRFDQLTQPSNMHTGDAVSCSSCRAVMSHLSTIDDSDANDKVIMAFIIIIIIIIFQRSEGAPSATLLTIGLPFSFAGI